MISMKRLIKKAQVFLEEALPYMQKFSNKTVVIKYGGKAMQGTELKQSVMKDIAMLWFLGLRPVIVHGGGPEITKEMEKAALKATFVRGLRVTDEAAMEIIGRVFRKTNKEIRMMLAGHKVASADMGACLICESLDEKLGLVGKVVSVNLKKIADAHKNGIIPVISPVGIGTGAEKGKKYNVNADSAATAIATCLQAEKLTMLTDVDGVIIGGRLVSHLTKNEAAAYIADGSIHGGMIPKVEACIAAVESGCKKAHLINGTVPHSLLFEIFTDKGVGTEVVGGRG